MTHRHFLTLLGLVSLALLSCEDKQSEHSCEDDLPPVLDLPTGLSGEPTRIAALSIDEWVERDDSGETGRGGLLGAVFVDVTDFEEEPLDVIAFGTACVGEVGQPVIVTPPTTLPVESVTYHGVDGAPLSLTPDANDRIPPAVNPGALLSPDGGEELRVQVVPGEAQALPAFEISANAPGAIEDPRTGSALDGSLEISWIPGGGDYFEISITAAAPDPTLPGNRLRCLLRDDGCQVIPAGGIEWLRSYGAQEIRVRLKRHAVHHTAPAQDTLAELDIVRSVEFDHIFD